MSVSEPTYRPGDLAEVDDLLAVDVAGRLDDEVQRPVVALEEAAPALGEDPAHAGLPAHGRADLPGEPGADLRGVGGGLGEADVPRARVLGDVAIYP